MTIVTSLSTADGWDITLDDKDGNAVVLNATDKRCITAASGLIGIAIPRDSRRPRPTGHGGLNDTRWTDGSLVALQGEISSSTSYEDAVTEFRTITKPMKQTLNYGAALLKWTEGTSGLSLQRLVKIASDVDGPVAGLTEGLIPYQVQFFAEDPRAYSQTLTTVTGEVLSVSAGGDTFPDIFPDTFTPSGGGAAACTNAGNDDTPPIFRVYGLCTNPQILNVDTGERIVLTKNGVTVSAGDYLEVDVASRTVTLNGATAYQQVVTSELTDWFDLPAEETTNIRLLSDTFDASARVDVLFRSAYS